MSKNVEWPGHGIEELLQWKRRLNVDLVLGREGWKLSSANWVTRGGA